MKPTPSYFYIPSLDGIRALAILLVFFAHAGWSHWVPGGLGVTIFFFLSGFLITTLLRRELHKTGKIHLGKFYLRRILRIWPVFYLVLLTGVLLTKLQLLPGELMLIPVLGQAFHLANYTGIKHASFGITIGSSVYWSLAVEEHFYLIFPAILFAMSRNKWSPLQQWWIFIGICVAILAWRYLLVSHFHAIENRTYMASDTRFDSLLFGCALAVYKNPVLDPVTFNEKRFIWVYIPLALIALGLTLLIRDPVFRETIRYTLQGIALTPLFIAAITFKEWKISKLLNHPTLKYLGVLSYSFYLVHHTIIEAFRHYFPDWTIMQLASVALVTSLLVSHFLFTAMEKPTSKLRHKLSIK